MLVLVENQTVKSYPYSLNQLKTDNPNVSFPSVVSEATLASFGVFTVTATNPPGFDPSVNVVEDTPVFDKGVWTQVWKTQPATAEEVSARNEQKAKEVRADRNRRLAASDWTQLSDAPVGQTAWAVYRQALRDVPAQTGFPWEITWPVAP